MVAYYATGIHGIVGESDTHTGSDLVMQAGNGGVFQQWFLGTSETQGNHWDHSVWIPAKDNTCPNGWVFISNPYSAWGDYFEPGVDYCVHTNDYALGL